MEFQEFDGYLEAARTQGLGSGYPEEFTLFDSWRATDRDIQQVESRLNIRLPKKYTEFMRRHGGGTFMFLDILPILSPDDRAEDLVGVNIDQFQNTDFVAASPVGTGDWWGFSCSGGMCGEEIYFWDHETGNTRHAFVDFLEFLAHEGLRAGVE